VITIYVAVFGVLLVSFAAVLFAASALRKRKEQKPAPGRHDQRPEPQPKAEPPTVIELAPQRTMPRPYAVWPDDGDGAA